MKKLKYLTLLAIMTCAFTTLDAAETPKIGVVDFKVCVEQSKIGKQEQETFETFKDEMEGALAEKEKEISVLAGKLNDADYIDGLSPDAENELKHRYRTLGQEMNQYQSQYYQALQQANFKIVQKIGDVITEASEAVAKKKGLDLILNEETAFFYSNTLDVSNDVVALMDDTFEKTQK